MDGTLCVVCGNPARCCHYEALSCAACKMFFTRRIGEIRYCELKGQCYKIKPVKKPYNNCKYCRLQSAIEGGMKLSVHTARVDQKKGWMLQMINQLVSYDNVRNREFRDCFTTTDLKIAEIVRMDSSFSLQKREQQHEMSIPDWCFMQAVTAIRFLMKPVFMNLISQPDKILLLKSFYFKASFTFWGFRMYRNNIGSLQTPLVDGVGHEIYPDSLLGHLNLGMRKLTIMRQVPVAMLAKYQVTREEMLLVLMILFCNPAVRDLSQDGIDYVTNHQRVFTSVLLDHCLTKHGPSGAGRFNELLGLRCPLEKCEEDTKMLIISIRSVPTNPPVQRLVCDEA